MGDLLQHLCLDFFKRGDAKMVEQQGPVPEAGYAFVPGPRYLAQRIRVLHVGAVGGCKPLGRKEATTGLEVAQLQQKAAAYVPGYYGLQQRFGPFGKRKEEGPLRGGELGERIKLATLSCIEQREGTGHRKGVVGKCPSSDRLA